MSRFINNILRHKYLFTEYSTKKQAIDKALTRFDVLGGIAFMATSILGVALVNFEHYMAGSMLLSSAAIYMYGEIKFGHHIAKKIYKKQHLHIMEKELFALLKTNIEADLQHLEEVYGDSLLLPGIRYQIESDNYEAACHHIAQYLYFRTNRYKIKKYEEDHMANTPFQKNIVKKLHASMPLR